jgi:hypothetical protein
MIFPPVRISQLSRDVELKRAAFEDSKAGVQRAVRRKLSPLNLLRENPQWLIGAVMSFVGVGGLGKVFGVFTKNGHSSNGKKSGLLASLLRFGGRTAMRTVAPVAFSAVKFAFKSAFRSFRHRGSEA